MADAEVVRTGRAPVRRRHRAGGPPPSARVAVVGAVVVAMLAVSCGWLGYRFVQEHRAEQARAAFLEAGQQGAVNLTSIDYARADADVQRILDSATGQFRDDFTKRSAALVDVVKKTQSRSIGTVTAAGLESTSAEEAQVLVALSVQTTNRGTSDPQPSRYWRMRLTVNRIGDGVKISKVDFVP